MAGRPPKPKDEKFVELAVRLESIEDMHSFRLSIGNGITKFMFFRGMIMAAMSGKLKFNHHRRESPKTTTFLVPPAWKKWVKDKAKRGGSTVTGVLNAMFSAVRSDEASIMPVIIEMAQAFEEEQNAKKRDRVQDEEVERDDLERLRIRTPKNYRPLFD